MNKRRLPEPRVDALLFKPEPPTDPRMVTRMFCGRQRVLAVALNRMKSGLDLDGNRHKQSTKHPWVIHGESRSGKSHLARRIFSALPETDTRLQIRIIVGRKLDALRAMQDVFEAFREKFNERIRDGRLDYDPTRMPEIQMVKQLVDRIQLFQPGVQTVTLSCEDSTRGGLESTFEAGAEAAPIPFVSKLFAKFVSKVQRDQSQRDSVQLCLRPPTPADLAEVCGIMAEALVVQGLVQHVLVLLDDFDLLDNYISPEENAKKERAILADAVRVIHETPCVDVVLTARSWYYCANNKQLVEIVDLFRHPMSTEELVQIYDLQLKVYGGKTRRSGFLSKEAVKSLASDLNGSPGLFLQHLKTAFQVFQFDLDSSQRGYDWLLNDFRARIEADKEHNLDGYGLIRSALRDGRLTIDVRSGNLFFGTRLENEHVFQSYASETSYFISPLLRRIFPPDTSSE